MRLEVAKDLILRGAKRCVSKDGSAVGALCLSQRARGRSARLRGRVSKLDGRKSKPVGRKSKSGGRKSKADIQTFQRVIAESAGGLGDTVGVLFALLFTEC
jgi:hypothetical protein